MKLDRLAHLLRLKTESDALLHLDLMRFVAAAGILWHHSHEFLYSKDSREELLLRTQELGLMVDLFFVISGFVITYVYSNRLHNAADFGRFMQRRIGRLVPLHLATMVAAIILTALVLAIGIEYPTAPTFSARCIVSTVFLVHEVVPCGGIPFNGVNWSISVEMALYVLFPVMLFVSRWSRFVPWAICVAAIAGCLALSDNWFEVYRPLRGVASFSFGMALYCSRQTLAKIPHADIALLVTTTLLIVAMMIGASVPVVMMLVFAVGVFAVAADSRGKVRPLVRRLAPLGQLTYSIYMIHWLVILVLLNAIGDKLLGLSTLPMALAMLGTYGVIFFLSLVSFHFFETPCRRVIDSLRIFGPRSAGANRRVDTNL